MNNRTLLFSPLRVVLGRQMARAVRSFARILRRPPFELSATEWQMRRIRQKAEKTLL
jgi:hypothetical protein